MFMNCAAAYAESIDYNGPSSEPLAGAVRPEFKSDYEPPVENIVSLDYAKLAVDDTCHVLCSPFKWDAGDWMIAGLGASAIILTAAFIDKPLQKEIQNHRTKASDKLARGFEPFGAAYSAVILGAFELEGMTFDDDRSKAVAQDGIAASLIATGIIAFPLKILVGRSRPNRDKGEHDFSPFSSDASFPSMHTTQAFAVASVVAEHYDSFWVKAGSYGLASMVGYSRMESNSHWASDVLAGAIIGTFVGKTVVRFNKDKRYEISATTLGDGESAGVRVTHSF